MKGKAIIIAVMIAVGVAVIVLNMVGEKQPKRLPVIEGLEAPDIQLKSLDGSAWQLASNRGNVVLINFWATWCDSCKEEMPGLQHLYDALKNDPKFQFVGILYNDDPDAAMRYQSENGFTLPVYLDPNSSAAAAYGLTGVPETYIVDKKGVLRKKFIGPVDFDNPDAVAFFRRILAE